ncbi:anti-sigma factor family protein [Acidiphilium iwatense]|uniref:Transmembrane anti-sigma factor n=1 Tax=Acidiphilium iwatense TaxID=768198 RepID=A0ABS9E0P7_9PROT|nr:hypothetical protein [Acidiphilium iwatense]MCF3948593.1 hypothetical protein [Acidiphilium iwatense]
MTHSMPPITDDDLHAYVDGKLDDARRAVVEDYLINNPGQRRRVDAWIAQTNALRATFDPVMTEPLPPELTMAHIALNGSMDGTGQRQQRARSWFGPQIRAAAGFLIALGLGGAAGWFGHGQTGADQSLARDTGIPSLALESKAAYQIFADRGHDRSHPTKMTHPTAQPSGDPAAIWHRVGRKFRLPDLTAAGFQRIEVDWVATIHGPAAAVLYRDQSGDNLILLVRKMEIPASTIRMVEHRGRDHTSFAWIHGGIGYAVIADTLPQRLHRIANQIRDDENAI